MNKEYVTTTQAAEILGISRMHVVRKIKAGEIKATKVGRSFLIPKEELSGIFKPIDAQEKRTIAKGVERAVKEYGDVLKKLGKE